MAHVHVESEIVARKNRAVPKQGCALTEPDADPCAPCGGASGSARSRPETAAPSLAAWRVGAPGAARPQSSSNLTSIGNSQYNPSQNSIPSSQFRRRWQCRSGCLSSCRMCRFARCCSAVHWESRELQERPGRHCSSAAAAARRSSRLASEHCAGGVRFCLVLGAQVAAAESPVPRPWVEAAAARPLRPRLQRLQPPPLPKTSSPAARRRPCLAARFPCGRPSLFYGLAFLRSLAMTGTIGTALPLQHPGRYRAHPAPGRPAVRR